MVSTCLFILSPEKVLFYISVHSLIIPSFYVHICIILDVCYPWEL